MMALQEPNDNGRGGQHHCRDCGVYFESSKSLDVHVQYHKENLLTKWANQAAAAANAAGDTENNNVKSRREFATSVAAAADSTDMKNVLPQGPGRPNSTSSYPPASSPFTHPHTPTSYTSAPSPYQNDVQRYSPSHPGPSPSSTSYGFSNGTGPGEPYQMPYNGYSPRSQPPMDPSQHFYSDNAQQENFILGPNTDFPTIGHRVTTPNSPSSSTSFRFGMFNKNCYPLDKNGVSSSSRAQSPHQCEKCGFVCDSQSLLAEHVKSAHSSSPMGFSQNQNSSAFQTPETFYRTENIKTEVVQDSPDILDLDSQPKVFRGPDEDSGPIPPSSNPHSVTAMLTPWSNNMKSQYPQPFIVSSSNPNSLQSYSPQNGPVPSPSFQSRSFPPDTYNTVPQPSNVPNQSINTNSIPSATSPKLSTPSNSLPHGSVGGNNSKGDSWKSNEARRPKTYNCSACNKWFTSSGHLKRHYNTTLHKNAVKQSGHPDPAALPISSHHHPNRDPSYIHSSKTPPGVANPSPNVSSAPKPKKAKSISPQGDGGTPSPALSNTNEGDSSRSNDNLYDRYSGPVPNGNFDRPLQHGFGNGGFDMIQTGQASAFGRTTPASYEQRSPAAAPQAFEQRTTGQGFERVEFEGRPQNGYTVTELNRPGSNPELPPQHYEYYRYDNRLPLNQQNSTNQVSAQPPNFQAGPSVSPSGGLPICHPSLPSLRTQNLMTTYMGENTLMHLTSELPLHQHGPLTTLPFTSSHTIIGNVDPLDLENLQPTPLPSFSNFQTSIMPNFSQTYPESLPFCKGFYVPSTCQDYSFIKTEPVDRSEFICGYLEDSMKTEPQAEEKKASDVMKLLNIKIELDTLPPRRSPTPQPPRSPDEFPSSTNLDMEPPPKKKRKKAAKKKPEESSNLVSSTGSPQPSVKKNVIKCEECDKYFNRICYLTQHNKSFHSGVKPFKCDRCGKRFHSEVRAKDHSKKHGGEKPYKCEICPKSFNHKTDLRRHLCLHTGEKPFSCGFCGKGFIRKDHMLKHFDTHKNGKRKYLNKVIEDLLVDKDKVETG